MAHKKGLGSSRNGRESNAQRLGVKTFAGEGREVAGRSSYVSVARALSPGRGRDWQGRHSLRARCGNRPVHHRPSWTSCKRSIGRVSLSE